MERKSKGTMAYNMKPSSLTNKIKKSTFDIDDVVDSEAAAELEALESSKVKKPKGLISKIKNGIKVRRINKAAKKRFEQ